MLRDIEGIELFKITQYTLDKTVIQIVKNKNYIINTEKNIEQVFKKRLGSNVQIEFEYVSEIKKESSGKFRYVISHVKQNH